MSNVCVFPPSACILLSFKGLRLKGGKKSSLRGRIKGRRGVGLGGWMGKGNFSPLKNQAAVTRQPADQVSKPDKEL